MSSSSSAAASLDKLEADALRSPLTVRGWVLLVRALDEHPPAEGEDAQRKNLIRSYNRLNEVFERSLRHNPYSYKLWVTYVNHRISQWDKLSRPTAEDAPVAIPHLRIWTSIIKVFERALEKLPHMPLLWTKFLEFLACDAGIPAAAQRTMPTMFTKFRVALIDALHALPVTQHTLVWNVFRKWTSSLRLDAAPFSSLHSLWQLLLKGNASDRVMGEYVQFLVKCQRNDALLQYLCTLGQWSAVHAKWTLPKMCQDPVFWDLVGGVLLSNTKSPNPSEEREAVDSEHLTRFVLLGTAHSLQPDRLVLSLAVFLIRRGRFSDARKLLSNVVETTTNTSTFQDAFVALVRMEEQLLDCVALDETSVQRFPSEAEFLGFLQSTLYSMNQKHLDASAPFNPLRNLTTLVHDYPLLLNAVQLRQKPHDARLWLKRVECLYERAAIRGLTQTDASTCADVEQVLSQGVTLCKRNHVQHHADGLTHDADSNPQGVDRPAHDVSSLYLAWADLLVSAGRFDEAAELLKKATFSVTFATLHANALLFGRLVEVLCMTSSRGTAASDVEAVKGKVLTLLMDMIRGELDEWSEWKREKAVSGGQQRRVSAGSMFLGQRVGAGGVGLKVLCAPGIWATAWDVVFWAEGPAGPNGEELARWMGALGLYTPSIAIGRASRLRGSKLYVEAFLLLEDALNRCHQGTTAGAVAALELADAAAATVIEHMQHLRHHAAPTEDEGGEEQSTLWQLQVHGTRPADGVNVALFTEKLRGVLRQGLVAARSCAAADHPLQSLTFFFTAAACEEYIGVYGHCIATLLDATRTFHTRLCKRTKAAALLKEQQSAAVDGNGDALPSVAGEQESAEAAAQLRADEDWFLKCVEAYSSKLLRLRGANVFFADVSALLKWTLTARCQSEIALRITSELAKCRLVDKCRAVFTMVAPTQNPVHPSGELFWGAWATFERDFGVEATFTSCQRAKRNVMASFSKSEVKFENQ
jgi:hypothetical protein